MTATTDNFSEVVYNNAELADYADQNNQQYFAKSRLFDQVIAKLIPFLPNGLFTGDPKFQGEYGKSIGAFSAKNLTRALCLTPGGAYPWVGTAEIASNTLAANEVAVAPGTMFQLVGDDDAGTDANLLAYTFTGTENVTIAAGDGSHPRVDLIEMNLALATVNPTSRIVATLPVQASLNLGALTAHENSVIQAIVAGKSGNNISIALVAGASLAYSESGNAITITYVSGTTTVSAVESIIASDSTLISILTAGTGANVLVSPGDSLSSTPLANGTNQVLDAQTIDKTRQVQCTLQVKQGTPATSPVVPTPDAGFCAVAMVVVGTSYATSTQIVAGVDTAGAAAVLHDLRIPLGVRSYSSTPADFHFNSSTDWQYGTANWDASPQAANKLITIPLKGAASHGRLLAVALSATFPTSANATVVLGRLTYSGGSFPTFTALGQLTSQLMFPDATQHYKNCTMDCFESQETPAAGPTVQPDATNAIGPPVWTSGLRTPGRPFETGTDTASPDELDTLAIQINSGTTYAGQAVFRVVWFVAEGL